MTEPDARSVVRRYFEEYHNDRDRDILEDIAATELVAPTQASTAAVATAFPDYRLVIKAQVAEHDVVATVWHAEGTHEGEWDSPIGSVPPTGRRVQWTGTTTLRVVGGRMTEVIGSNWDHLGILQQLGTVESAQPRAGA